MITGGDPAGVFAINAATGQITIADNSTIDFDSAPTSYALSVTASDGANTSAAETVTINLTDVNEPPVVATSSGNATFTEDAGPVAIDATLFVSDPEDAGFVGAEVRFDSGFVPGQDDLLFTNQSGTSGVYNATSGVLTLSGTASVAAYETALRTVTYSNFSQNPNTGNRLFRFTVNDGLNVGSATRTLTVIAQDDPANVVTGGPYSVAEGASVALDGSASSDVDNFIVEYSWDFDYDGVTFTTDSTGDSPNFSAAGIDGPDTRTIALRTRSDNGVFAIATTTVTISNVAPTANADSSSGFTTDEDSVFVTGNVLSNDTDPGPESLAVSSLDTAGTIGQVVDRGDGTFTYDPNGQFETLAPGQSANDTFSYTMTDGNAADTATVTILISGMNDAPIVTDQNVAVDENPTLNTLVATAAATDIDTGDSVSWTITGGNTNGAFSINSTSGEVRVAKPLELDFESNPSYSLTVQGTDENGGVDTGVITVSLNDLNEAPTANDATIGIAENSASGTSVGFVSGSDPDTGDTLTWSILSGNTTGTFSLNSATGELIVANPSTLNFETTPIYTLNVQIQDAGGLTDPAVVVVNVSNVDEAPTTTGLADVFVNEDSADVVIDLKTAFSDVETPSAALSYSIVGNSNSALFGGTPIVGGNLTLNFAANANGNAIVIVRATDPQGLFVTTAFNVVVAPVADAPTSTPDSYVVFGDQLTVPPVGGVLANDFDPDGDTLSALLVSGPANGSLVLLSNGGFTYTPNDEFSGIDTFVYEPFDGTATGPQRTVVLNVNRVIAPPPPPADSGSSDSGESDDGDSAADTDSGESAEATIDAPPSAVDGSAQGSVVVESADGAASQANESADDDAEEELTGVYTASESGGDFFSGLVQRLELRDATSVSVKTLNTARSDGDTTDSDNRFGDSLRFDGEDLSYLVSTEFIQELEQVEDEFEFDGAVPEWATGTAVATTASISVGYIMWMLRGGYVLASVLSTMPVWQNIDPLPVLAALEAADDEDDDSLETMIDRASDEADDSEGPNADEAASDAEQKDKIV
jgi:VCBS repeat-containing protein